MEAKINVLIIGATGLTGSHLIKQLVDDTQIDKVYALVRSKSDKLPNSIIQIEIDFEHLQESTFPKDVSTIFLCLGTTMAKAGSKEAFVKVDKGYNLSCARIAHANGCKRAVLISAMGANAQSSVFYSKVKGDIENELAQIGFERVDIFQPALLIGSRNEHRFFEGISQRIFGRWTQKIDGILGNYTSIGADQLAGYMKATLLHHKHGVYTHTYKTFKKLLKVAS